MSGVTDFSSQAQALAAALLAATTDPADSVRMLATLAAFNPSASTPVGGVGSAMAVMQTGCGDLFRRSALAALCRATASYQPASFDDAVAVRTLVCGLLDAEIMVAGDSGADATFNALRALRAAVVKDLTTRGADLAKLTTVTSNQPLPAPVLAQRVYRDPDRADELVTQVDSPHPAFMPTSFRALAS